ncbi:MAG: hypothetical protein ACYTGW_04805 [Planctomycetota bacterium]
MLATTASLLALGLLSVSLPAQGTFTSPLGYDTKEGATDHAYILGNRVGLTWQQIDSTLRGRVLSVKSIAWRRDGNLATNAAYVKRTMEVEIFLANSELTKISKTHSANYVGTPTRVVNKKTVSAPDWTAAPTTAPAPFNFKVPFDTGWVFLGKNDFLWEVRVTKNSYTGTAFSNYPFDFQYVVSGSSFNNNPSTPSTSTALGTGCTASGKTSPFTLSTVLYNHGVKFRLQNSATNGPATTQVNAYFSIKDPNLAIPGWCERVHVDPMWLLPLGKTSTTGSVGPTTLDNIPYNRNLIGFPIFVQAGALDTGRGIFILSNGVKFAAGADPKYPKVGRIYTYNTTSGTTTSGPWTGGIIAQFTQ